MSAWHGCFLAYNLSFVQPIKGGIYTGFHLEHCEHTLGETHITCSHTSPRFDLVLELLLSSVLGHPEAHHHKSYISTAVVSLSDIGRNNLTFADSFISYRDVELHRAAS